MTQWERWLNITLSPADRLKCYTLTHTFLITCKSREKNYKIMTRWYRSPVMIQKMFPHTFAKDALNKMALCYIFSGSVPWYAPSGKGSMINIPKLSLTHPPHIPQLAFLSIIPWSISKMQKCLLRFFLIAAGMVILRQWRTSCTLSKEWTQELDGPHNSYRGLYS